MTCFPTCSTFRSCSQAPLCHCTRRLVSNQAEGTIARLRYFLGGDRPSQTPHQTVSSSPIRGRSETPELARVVFHIVAPPKLAPRLQSLPPMLHRQALVSLSS